MKEELAGKDFLRRTLDRIFKDEQEIPSFNGHSEDKYHPAEGDYQQIFRVVG